MSNNVPTSLYNYMEKELKFGNLSPLIERFLQEFLFTILKEITKYEVNTNEPRRYIDYIVDSEIKSSEIEEKIERRVCINHKLFYEIKKSPVGINIYKQICYYRVYFLLPRQLFTFNDETDNDLVLGIYFTGRKYEGEKIYGHPDWRIDCVFGKMNLNLSEIEEVYGRLFISDDDDVVDVYESNYNLGCTLTPEQFLTLLIKKEFQKILDSFDFSKVISKGRN